jgi:hypothetical protein
MGRISTTYSDIGSLLVQHIGQWLYPVILILSKRTGIWFKCRKIILFVIHININNLPQVLKFSSEDFH